MREWKTKKMNKKSSNKVIDANPITARIRLDINRITIQWKGRGYQSGEKEWDSIIFSL